MLSSNNASMFADISDPEKEIRGPNDVMRLCLVLPLSASDPSRPELRTRSGNALFHFWTSWFLSFWHIVNLGRVLDS